MRSFIYFTGIIVIAVVTAVVSGPITYAMVSTALGPIGLCPDFFPFYTESLGFYMELRDIRPLLGIDYPGFESKEDFQAHKDLYVLENDRRFSDNNLSIPDQRAIVMAAGTAATVAVLYGSYRVLVWWIRIAS